MVQYNRTFSAPSSDMQAVFANKVDFLDRYILCQTGEDEYTGLIYDRASKETTEIVFSRSYNDRYWTVTENTVDGFDYSISNEYYCFSNVGIGRSLTLPVTDEMIGYSLTIICCLCCLLCLFWTVFKGVFKK